MFERPHSLIDEMIREAMDQGKFNNLPGAGKPLKLDDDSHVPEELRLAHRMLKQHDLAPDWIVEGAELRDGREVLIKRLRREKQLYARALENAASTPSPEVTRRALHMAWDLNFVQLRETVDKFNRRVMGYNLKVPPGIPHIEMVYIDRELRHSA